MVYVVVHVTAICIFGPWVTFYRIGDSGQMYNRVLDIPNHKAPDILFIGSSHTYRGIDTRIFARAGVSAFNLGSSAQTPMQTELLLGKYLDEIAPKSVVFEVYPVLFQNDGVESTADLISNDHIDAGLCRLAIESGNIKLINTLVYGIYQEYVCKIRTKTRQKDTIGDDLYVSGGYVEKMGHTSFFADDLVEPVSVTIDPRQLTAFSNCVRMVNDRQLPYIIIKAPLPQSTNANLVGLKEFGEAMCSFGTYLDFNDLMVLDDTCFFDSHHLTESGVELFDSRLIQAMDSMGFVDQKVGFVRQGSYRNQSTSRFLSPN